MATRKKPQPDTEPEPEITVDEATGEVIDEPATPTPEDVVDAEVVEDDHDTTPAGTGDVTPAVTPTAPPTVHAMLPVSSDSRDWTDEQKALLDAAGLVKRQGGQAVPAPRATIAAFLSHCHRTGLDPIARQIYCIERGGKWTIQVSIDGFRLIAERSGQYRGQTPVQWTADGREWLDVWVDAKAPAAARVGVYRTGFTEPLYAVARFSSYDAGGPMWKKMPEVMIAKVAEMLALRKAFPMELSGLYGTEEMDQAAPAQAPAQRQITPTVSSPQVIRSTPADQPTQPRRPVRSLFKDGEHQAPAEPGPVVTVDLPDMRGVTPEETEAPMALAPTPMSEEDWATWKESIDEATSMAKLAALRNEAIERGILESTIPGDSRPVSAYFDHRRQALTAPPAGSAAQRLQAGIKRDVG